MHLMIDEETLGLDTVEGPLVQISVVPFELLGDGPSDAYKSFDIFLDPNQKHLGRTIEPGTLVFWLKENPALLLSILDGTLAASRQFDTFPATRRQYHPAEAMQALSQYIVNIENQFGLEGVHANGPTFDCQFIEHMCKQTGYTLPWKYNKPRCVRTSNMFGDILGDTFWDEGTKTPLEESGAKHDALVDCHRQIRWVQNAYRGLHALAQPNSVELEGLTDDYSGAARLGQD